MSVEKGNEGKNKMKREVKLKKREVDDRGMNGMKIGKVNEKK
jgi:hypothetical protein